MGCLPHAGVNCKESGNAVITQAQHRAGAAQGGHPLSERGGEKRREGEDPMVRRTEHVLVATMKTTHAHPEHAASAAHHHPAKPQAGPVNWHKAMLPQIGRREPVRATDEWRPGESAKRGYEKAVEDWWWL